MSNNNMIEKKRVEELAGNYEEEKYKQIENKSNSLKKGLCL